MSLPDISDITANPRPFFEFLRRQDYPVFHKSNLFFRDIQYGLWRFLGRDQVRLPYAQMEQAARQVVEELVRRGILKPIGQRNFELNMPEFVTVIPGLDQTRKRGVEVSK